jgi:hypothetical protein
LRCRLAHRRNVGHGVGVVPRHAGTRAQRRRVSNRRRIAAAQSSLYVFPKCGDEVRRLADTIHDPEIFIKVCAPPSRTASTPRIRPRGNECLTANRRGSWRQSRIACGNPRRPRAVLVITGGAAGGLTGLTFVVITLAADAHRVRPVGVKTFVMSFCRRCVSVCCSPWRCRCDHALDDRRHSQRMGHCSLEHRQQAERSRSKNLKMFTAPAFCPRASAAGSGCFRL